MLRERYLGTLLGLACGDALGGPVEFMSAAEISALHPDGLRDFTGGGWLHLSPGEITDDTQMTLALAHSLASSPSLDMTDVAARFLEWYHSNPKDIGNTTRASLAGLAAGEPWDVAGQRVADDANGTAAGNGSVMRCAPVALRFRRDPEALVQGSIDTARVTHADPRCIWGAVAINQALVHLLNGGSRDGAIEAAASGIENAETVAAVNGAASLQRSEVPSGGFVLDSVAAALWALVNHDSLEETIIAAVALGGDSDTTGAVAGALAGALYGAPAIPDRWLNLLQPRQELESLADQLLAVAG